MAVFPEIDRFPHLMPADIVLWKKFLIQHKGEFTVYAYDIHVGAGAPIPPDTPPEYVKSVEASTKKRIDVVAHKPGEVWIIEVKPYASLSAIGQILCYAALYEHDFKPTEKIVKCVVTDVVYPDEAFLFAKFGILSFVV